MRIVIIGKRSFLSQRFKELMKGSHLVSSNFINKKEFANKYVRNNTTFIINSFYPLFKILENSTDNKKLINQSVIFLINFLLKISKKKILKFFTQVPVL